MEVRSTTLVSSFKPIRVEIDLMTGRDMDTMHGILTLAQRHAFAGTYQMRMIEKLLPHFERLG